MQAPRSPMILFPGKSRMPEVDPLRPPRAPRMKRSPGSWPSLGRPRPSPSPREAVLAWVAASRRRPALGSLVDRQFPWRWRTLRPRPRVDAAPAHAPQLPHEPRKRISRSRSSPGRSRMHADERPRFLDEVSAGATATSRKRTRSAGPRLRVGRGIWRCVRTERSTRRGSWGTTIPTAPTSGAEMAGAGAKMDASAATSSLQKLGGRGDAGSS